MTGNRLTLSLYNYDEPGDNFPDAPTTGIGSSGMDWEQASGLDYYSGRNNVRFPAYHRLDIGMSLYKDLGGGRRSIWNFSLYNAYCRMNAMTIRKDDYVDASRPNRAFKSSALSQSFLQFHTLTNFDSNEDIQNKHAASSHAPPVHHFLLSGY